MAITKLGTDAHGIDGASTSLTVSHTLAAGTLGNRKVIVVVGTEVASGSAITATVTYGGVSMSTQATVTASNGSTTNWGRMFYLDEASLPGNGTHNVVATLSGTTGDVSMQVMAYEDIAQGASSNFDTTGEGSPADATIENDIAAVGANDWALSYTSSGNVGSFSASGSQTEVWDDQAPSTTHQFAELRGGSGQTQLTSTFTGSNNRLFRICAVWGPGAAPPPSVTIGALSPPVLVPGEFNQRVPPFWPPSEVARSTAIVVNSFAELSGTADGAGTATAALLGDASLSGTSAGAATPAADLDGTAALAGTSAGSATTDGDLDGVAALSGTSAGVGDASGDVTGDAALAGSAAGIGAPTGDLVGDAALSGASDGTASVTGSAVATMALAGTAAGTGSPTANLVGRANLAGTSDGAGSPTADLVGRAALAGTSDGTSTASADLTVNEGQLTGSTAGVATVAGSLVGVAACSGSTAGAGSHAANLAGSASLSATAAGTSSVTGDLTLDTGTAGSLAGTVACAAAVAGNLTGSASCSGTTAGTAIAAASLQALASLAGTAAGAASTTGNVTRITLLAGQAPGTSQADALLRAHAALAGLAASLASATANLQGAPQHHLAPASRTFATQTERRAFLAGNERRSFGR